MVTSEESRRIDLVMSVGVFLLAFVEAEMAPFFAMKQQHGNIFLWNEKEDNETISVSSEKE